MFTLRRSLKGIRILRRRAVAGAVLMLLALLGTALNVSPGVASDLPPAAFDAAAETTASADGNAGDFDGDAGHHRTLLPAVEALRGGMQADDALLRRALTWRRTAVRGPPGLS